jgi:hypothetical protein
MRQLHVVEDETLGGHVVLATSDGLERFALEVDHALRTAVTDRPAASTPPPSTAPPSSEPRITPREIQIRIRAGEEPSALAEACGAGLDWVLRFAGPVLSERTRVADEARRAKARRRSADTLDDGQLVVFGEAVDARFAAHGIDPADVRWDAHRREDGQWVITARWIGGQSEHAAEWMFQLSTRTVAPADDTAADLLSDRPIRPMTPQVEPEQTPSLTVAPPLMPGHRHRSAADGCRRLRRSGHRARSHYGRDHGYGRARTAAGDRSRRTGAADGRARRSGGDEQDPEGVGSRRWPASRRVGRGTGSPGDSAEMGRHPARGSTQARLIKL